MAVEEQTTYNTARILHLGVAERSGQRLTISNRMVSKLGFWLRKYGSPDGSYYFAIRKISGDAIIVREAAGVANDLTETVTYMEYTFSSPVFINEEVRIMVEYGEDGSGNATNLITTYWQNTDVKADEFNTYMQDDVYIDWDDFFEDHAYRYTYSVLSTPSVTTDPATSIRQTTATLNGTLDDDGGEACDCGFEWGETIAYGNTTPTQSRTTGQTFAQTITGLKPGVTYHFRAFATNGAGTGNGTDRTFQPKMTGLNPAVMEVLG